MKLLSSFADNVFSQFGEDGIIAHLFSVIGEGSRICVEFGAGDGNDCSNTANLWRKQGWNAVLIEADAERFDLLEGNARLFDAKCHRVRIEPEGMNCISKLLIDHNVKATVDFMSIDVDGDDYFILKSLTCRPRVISVEFNPTIPPHIELYQQAPGGTFGASLLAMIRVGAMLGYTFVGATYCNAFFVNNDEAGLFSEYEKSPELMSSLSDYTYVATDFAGRTILCGRDLPWGAREPYVMPLASSATLAPVTDSVQNIRRGFESLWGPAQWFSSNGLSRERLEIALGTRPPLACIDTTWAAPDSMPWLRECAESFGYKVLTVGKVIGLAQ